MSNFSDEINRLKSDRNMAYMMTASYGLAGLLSMGIAIDGAKKSEIFSVVGFGGLTAYLSKGVIECWKTAQELNRYIKELEDKDNFTKFR